MARKFSRSRRFAPSTERALFKDSQLSGRHIDRTDLIDAIRGGEDSYLEFKSRLSNPDKLAAGICALANSGGGTIVFGVTDQLRLEGVAHPELIEQDLFAICRDQLVPPVWARIDKVSFDSGLRLVVFEVDARRAPHRTTDGRYYIRVGATKREATGEEIAELYRARTGAHGFEDTPLIKSDVQTDIDDAALWTYTTELGGGRLELRADYPIPSLLADMRLGVRYGEDVVPSVAGILLFGKGTAVAKRLPQSPLVARRISGATSADEIVEEVEFVGDLASTYERAVQFVERFSDLWDARPKRCGQGPVAARPFLPREPVLEALSNALVHRDYAMQGPVRLSVYDDRLVVANPAPDSGLTRRALRVGTREPTNPRLKGIFLSKAYGVAESRGGIPMMLGATHEFTRGPQLRIGISPDEFRVEIPAV